MNDSPPIVLVGHCGADSWSLTRVVTEACPGVRIDAVNDQAAIAALSTGKAVRPVLLINRVLDGDFSAGDGLELIRQIAQSPQPPVMLLISNYDDAQAAAVAAGALRGFGKSQLNQPATKQALTDAMQHARGKPV